MLFWITPLLRYSWTNMSIISFYCLAYLYGLFFTGSAWRTKGMRWLCPTMFGGKVVGSKKISWNCSNNSAICVISGLGEAWVVKECSSVTSYGTHIWSIEIWTPESIVFSNYFLRTVFSPSLEDPRSTNFLPLIENRIINFSKFQVISPKVINHSMPRSRSQQPNESNNISEVKAVPWMVQESCFTIEFIVTFAHL